jgi:hypothetical protein
MDHPQQDFWRWMQRLTQGLSLGTVAVTVAMGMPSGGSASEPGRHRAAMAAYQAGRWSEAYVALSSLADQGDAEAARVAALMVRQGPLLFGQRFEASPERQVAWSRLTGIQFTAPARGPRPAGEPGAHEALAVQPSEAVAAR